MTENSDTNLVLPEHEILRPWQTRPIAPVYTSEDWDKIVERVEKGLDDKRYCRWDPYNRHSFRPRPYQFPVIQALQDAVNRKPGAKRNVYANIHRRGGKDHMGLAAIAHQMEQYPGSTCLVIAPTITHAGKIFFKPNNAFTGRWLLDDAFPKMFRDLSDKHATGISKLGMEVRWHNGSICIFTGSDEEKVRGMPADFIMFSEYQKCDPRMLDTVEKMTDVTDGILYINGTPFGENWFFDLYNEAPDEDWEKFTIPVTDSMPYSISEETWSKIQRRHKARGVDGIRKMEREYLCSFEEVTSGSIYGDQINEAIKGKRIDEKFDYNKSFPVYTVHDPGRRDSWVVWTFQVIPEGNNWTMRVIDCYATKGKGFDHMAEYCNGKPYRYSAHFFPHDAKQITTNAANNKSLADNFQNYVDIGKVKILSLRHKSKEIYEDRHRLVKWTFPEIRFAENTDVALGIKFLKQYRYKDDQEKQGQFYKTSPTPHHDICMDYADAFGYGVRAYEMIKKEKRGYSSAPRTIKRRVRKNFIL